MATLSVNTMTASGTSLASTLTAVTSAGDTFANDGSTMMVLNNANATSVYVATVVTGQTYGGYAVADQTVSLAASTTLVVGPFPVAVFGKTITMTWAGSVPATDCKVALFAVPRTGQ